MNPRHIVHQPRVGSYSLLHLTSRRADQYGRQQPEQRAVQLGRCRRAQSPQRALFRRSRSEQVVDGVETFGDEVRALGPGVSRRALAVEEEAESDEQDFADDEAERVGEGGEGADVPH